MPADAAAYIDSDRDGADGDRNDKAGSKQKASSAKSTSFPSQLVLHHPHFSLQQRIYPMSLVNSSRLEAVPLDRHALSPTLS